MQKCVLITMLSIMGATHAMNFDIDSEENFPSLEKTRAGRRQQGRSKKKNLEIKKADQLNEESDSNINNADHVSEPILSDNSQMLSPQLPEAMKQVVIYLPDKSDLWNRLDFHFCSHSGKALCEKLYGNNYKLHGKYLSQVLNDIDEIMKQYAGYMRSAQAPEWQIILRLSTAQRIIIRSVFSNHKEVSDFLESMLQHNKNKDRNVINHQARSYYPITSNIFNGNRCEAGIEFDGPW